MIRIKSINKKVCVLLALTLMILGTGCGSTTADGEHREEVLPLVELALVEEKDLQELLTVTGKVKSAVSGEYSAGGARPDSGSACTGRS